MNSHTNLIVSFNCLLLAAGLGFNTNPFETNVINLAVVIGVLCVFITKVVNNLLESRKVMIISSILNAQKDYIDVAERLNQAKTNLQHAKLKADQFWTDYILEIEQQQQLQIQVYKQYVEQSEKSNNTTFWVESQQTTYHLNYLIYNLSLSQAVKELTDQLNPNLHARMIGYFLELIISFEKAM
jgi:F-type H+-transporting ATPase subunit b